MYREILVIGAGVLGLSSALHLKRLNPEKKVLLIDRLGGAGQGNTAKSAGIFLNLFSTELNYLLSDSTVNWFHHLQNDLGYRLKITQYGYLYLLDKKRFRKLHDATRKAISIGVEIETYSREELDNMIPDLFTEFEDDDKQLTGFEPVEAGILGVKCGSIDTDALAHAIEAEYIKLGGEVAYNTTVEELIIEPKRTIGLSGEPFVWQDIRVSGAKSSRGEIRADTTVVATGVWSEKILAPLGLDPLMRPKKRVIYVFKDAKLRKLINTKGFNEYKLLPFTHIPMIRAYLKVEPTEESIWLGCADDLGRSYGLEDDPQPEKGLYSNNLYYALVRYLPCFKDLRPINSWAGQRAVNRYDKTPIVDMIPGMIYVGSATGYGITKCDAMGRVVATVYAGKKEAELYGERRIRAKDLSVENRRVEKESFKV